MSMTMEQVVTHVQLEYFTLRAQVAAESGFADAVRAINNFATDQVRKDIPSLIDLATAQVRKDTPSLIDVKGLGHTKRRSLAVRRISNVGRRRRRHSSVINESGMMLEC